MKKLIAIIIAAVLCASLIASCSGSDDKGSSEASQNGSAEQAESFETVKQYVLVGEKGVQVTTKNIGRSMSEDVDADKALNIEVDNGSDKGIEVGIINSSINGYMIPCDVTVTVNSGEKKILAAAFDEIKLMNSDITTFANIELAVSVKDIETGDDIIEPKIKTIKTSAAEGFEYKYDESGTTAYDSGGIKIVVKDKYVDEFSGQCVKLYTANLGKESISISTVDTFINDKKTESILYADVLPNKSDVSAIAFELPDDVEEIKKIKTSFVIYNSDTGKVIVDKTKPVTVEFE